MLLRDLLAELAQTTRTLLPSYAHAAAAGEPRALRLAHTGGRVLRIAELLLRCPFLTAGDLQILQREGLQLGIALEGLANEDAARDIRALAARLGAALRALATRAEDEAAIARRLLVRKTG